MEESKNRCYYLSEENNNNAFLKQPVEASLSVDHPAGENVMGASECVCACVCVCVHVKATRAGIFILLLHRFFTPVSVISGHLNVI